MWAYPFCYLELLRVSTILMKIFLVFSLVMEKFGLCIIKWKMLVVSPLHTSPTLLQINKFYIVQTRVKKLKI